MLCPPPPPLSYCISSSLTVLTLSLSFSLVSARPCHIFPSLSPSPCCWLRTQPVVCRHSFLITHCYFSFFSPIPSSSSSSSSSSSPSLFWPSCSLMCVCVCGGAWRPNEFDSCHLISVMRVAVVARGAGARGELGFSAVISFPSL